MTLIIILRLIYEAYFRFPHFKIIKAGMRKWVHRKSQELITYHIELKTKKCSSELIFEDLWINEKKYKFHLCRKDRKMAGNFSKQEILKLNIISELKDNLFTPGDPVVPKGMLVLGYKFRNKKKYLSIKKFRELGDLRLSNGS